MKSARPYFDYSSAARYIAFHTIAIAGTIWAGVTPAAIVCCVVLYYVRMFGVSAGFHRYFSHRTFKTSRPVQFLFAVLGMTSLQRGVLWWAGNHRLHHRYADTANDAHSPVVRGFWHAHMGWLFEDDGQSDMALMHDFAKYPELVWLDKHWLVVPVLLGAGVWLTCGWSGLFFGYGIGTILLWHGTFTVNSVAHLIGFRRFDTADASKNSPLLLFVTLGECWHNNHHYHMGSARQGLYWWELDVSYYVLRVMQWFGLVWDVREPPARVYEEAARRQRERQRERHFAVIARP